MAYYLENCERSCSTCKKRATVALKTSGTVTYGYYCRRCGEREVKRRNADERLVRNAMQP